ncbi:MAG: hypothetical protein ACHQ53_13945 [Polyangiales bacterium]
MPSPLDKVQLRHMRLGWLSLAVYASLGVVLEALHAFKVATYLQAAAEPRRLAFTLAHAHGVGLGLLNVLFALSLPVLFTQGSRTLRLASALLATATVLIPAGFLLGGAVTYDGDPGVGVLLVPLGAPLLLLALLLLSRQSWRG